MRRVSFLLLLMFVAGALYAQANRGPSTQEERDRAVKIAHESETNPLDPALRSDQDWLIKRSPTCPTSR